MLLGAAPDGADVGKLAVPKFAVAGLVPAAYGLGFEGSHPVRRQVGDLPFPLNNSRLGLRA